MSALDSLAPDQRAVVQLVLRQERSYSDIAELLGISADAVRKRAHAGVSALGAGADLPAERSAQLADFLLGQQDDAEREAARAVLERDPAAREWARGVAAELRAGGGRELPDIPGEPVPSGAAAPAEPDRPEQSEPARPEPGEPAAAPSRQRLPSSRLGGALLLGGLAIAVAAVLLIVLRDDGDEPSASPAAEQAQATPQARVAGEIRLRAVGDSKAAGVMRLVTDGRALGFELQAQRMPRNRSREAYAVWFVKRGGGARRLGFTNPVGADGRLGIAGPTAADQARFADLLARYDRVVVSRERSADAKRPGRTVLQGTLPRGR